MTSMPSPTLTAETLTTIDSFDSIYNDEYEYNDSDSDVFLLEGTTKEQHICEAECLAVVVINVIIFLFGILGNGVVIWIVAFKMKKMTVNTTWYLSLALSDFIFCATLPFNITMTATGSWNFGPFMCKFTSFVLFLNMFSSIFLMVIISIDRCVTVVCAVWAQNNRTLTKAAVAVVVAWLFSMLLSIPSLVFREETINTNTNYNTNTTISVTKCSSKPPDYIPVLRFVIGFVIPLILITVCYTVIIVRLQNKFATSTKPFKVMTALIVTFVISWLPYHVHILLTIKTIKGAEYGTLSYISSTFVNANSCMNPFLYAFMGRDVKQNLCSLVSKIENAFMEEKSAGSRASVSTSLGNSMLKSSGSKTFEPVYQNTN